MFFGGRRDGAIAAMRKAADLDDASEKNVAMENKLVLIRALLGELYLAAGMNKEALVEFEASDKVMPNRFRIIAGSAARLAPAAPPMPQSAIIKHSRSWWRAAATARRSPKRGRTWRKTDAPSLGKEGWR